MTIKFDFGDAVPSTPRWLVDDFPTEGRKVLLLDADCLFYLIGFTSTQEEYEAYTNGDEHMLIMKKDATCMLIRKWMASAGATGVELCFTGSGNFRHTLGDYKKNREGRELPPFFNELKEWLLSLGCARISEGNEADDLISIKMHSELKDFDLVNGTKHLQNIFIKYVIGSKDKDLKIVQGWHICLDTGKLFWVDELGELQPRIVEKVVKVPVTEKYYYLFGELSPTATEEEADLYTKGQKAGTPKFKMVKVGEVEERRQTIKSLKGTGYLFFCAQLLMGDSADGYYGLPKCGCTGAYNLLKDCTTKEDAITKAAIAYKEVYGSEWRDKLTLMGRLAWLQTYEGELWEIPAHLEGL